jgi:hypothetical protein
MTRRSLAAALTVVALAPATAEAQRPVTACAPFAANCAMPFPNDARLTVRDRATPTGVRLRLPSRAMPANKDGKRIATSAINRSDGFSPGQQIIVRVPGLTTTGALVRAKAPGLSDIGRYRARDAGVVVLDARTGRRHPIWVEIELNARRARDRNVLIHPATNFTYGRRYVVVLRNLFDAEGRRIAAPRGRAIASALSDVAPTLRRARISRRGVYLAWDFTVASAKSIQSPLLHMRDDAFAQLGDRNLTDRRVEGSSPAFSIAKAEPIPGDDRFAARVTGSFTVPCYLQGAGCPVGSAFNYAGPGRDALPAQRPGNVMQADLECIVPKRALTEPARVMQYGHGLLDSAAAVPPLVNVRQMAVDHNFVICATSWAGFAAEDVPYAVQVLNDASKFPGLVDRIQQGVLNHLFLGRLLLHPQGLMSHPAFQSGGRPVYDASELFYDGNSQGGILGPTLTAVTPDFERAVWGAAGMNYSVLLPRSVDFDLYSRIFFPAYPAVADRPLVLSLIQLLWDRGEANGWAASATANPPPNTPPHKALIHVAAGDEEVSTWTADALARTAGARARRPAIAATRTNERSPLYGIPSIPGFPFDGSGYVYWDPGAGWNGITPLENTPQRQGRKSHYTARNTPAAQLQKSEFLKRGGAIVDTCPAGAPCPATRTETS